MREIKVSNFPLSTADDADPADDGCKHESVEAVPVAVGGFDTRTPLNVGSSGHSARPGAGASVQCTTPPLMC